MANRGAGTISGRYMEVDIDATTGEVVNVDR